MLTRLCAQLFGFVVLAAALFVLPQAARAHAGHAHTMHAHATQAQATDAQAADVAAASHDVAEQSLQAAASSAPGQADHPPCSDRDCCVVSSCAACFSIVAPLPPLIAPPSLRSEVSLLANPQPPGIAGATLRRPPRSFA